MENFDGKIKGKNWKGREANFLPTSRLIQKLRKAKVMCTYMRAFNIGEIEAKQRKMGPLPEVTE